MSFANGWFINITKGAFGGGTSVQGNNMQTLVTAWRLSGISTAEIDSTQLSSPVKTYVMGTQDRGMIEFDMLVERASNNKAIVQRSMPTSLDGNWGGECSASAFAGGVLYEHICTWTGLLQKVTYDLNIDEAVSGTWTVRLLSMTYTVTPV